jgi:hypothetical protein
LLPSASTLISWLPTHEAPQCKGSPAAGLRKVLRSSAKAEEIVAVIRQQLKEGADFIKMCQTGPDSLRDGKFSTPHQYTEAELIS